MDITEMDFGKWLKEELKSRHWDKYDLSVESGLSPQAISYFMSGRCKPSYSSLCLLLKAFGKRMLIVDKLGQEV